ncbi:MAG: PAS domain-containing protein, partial [Flavisolibacter sp.]
MKTKQETRISLETLSYLPSFARYLLQYKLDEYVNVQLSFVDEVDIPMMRFFKNMRHDQLVELSKKSTTEFLTYLSNNQATEQIHHAIAQWLANQLPVIERHEVSAEDITMVTYLRKKTMLHFIGDYCRDKEEMIELIREIDFFLAASETTATNVYINLLKNDISENTHLIEKVNHTIPGAVYVFDLENFKGIYSNNKLAEIIGYSQEELNTLGLSAIDKLIHDEDRAGLQKHLENLKNAKDGDIQIFKYRVKEKSGAYRWLSNHEAVFKRNETGEVIQTIGITLDVNSEQQIADELRRSENRYKQAEGLAHIGNYVWDLTNNELTWSDEMFSIYNLKPAGKFSSELIRKFNHPEDNHIVNDSIQKAVDEKSQFDFYYRIVLENNIEKILHARGEVIPGDHKNAEKIIGTVQDETEKQTLIRELKQKESVYKQAEELVGMGNWSWDIKKNKLEWTDQ